jgi:cobalt/nickel transport protein
MKTITKLWTGLGVLAVVSPIGLFLPEKLKAGSAWGEWGADEIKGLVGYIPSGLEKISTVWNAILPDYAFKGWEGRGLGHLSFAYIISAIVGIALCVGGAFLLGKLLSRKQ